MVLGVREGRVVEPILERLRFIRGCGIFSPRYRRIDPVMSRRSASLPHSVTHLRQHSAELIKMAEASAHATLGNTLRRPDERDLHVSRRTHERCAVCVTCLQCS